MAGVVLSAAVTVVRGGAGRAEGLAHQVIMPKKSTPERPTPTNQITSGLSFLPASVEEAAEVGQTQGPAAGDRAFQVTDRPQHGRAPTAIRQQWVAFGRWGHARNAHHDQVILEATPDACTGVLSDL